MKSYPTLRRWLSAGIAVAIFMGVVALVIWMGQFRQGVVGPSPVSAEEKAALANVWPVFGGSAARNMVNTVEKNLPSDWKIEWDDKSDPDAKTGLLKIKDQKNIKWVVKLGTRAYGGPVIAGGRVYVGTNNDAPRNPKVKGDKGIVMCFRESDGGFLWQAIHDKLPSGQVHDWPKEGICSTAVVEGDRVYWVSNRCEVVCATVDGLRSGKNVGDTKEKYQAETDADIVWRLEMMEKLNVFPHNMAACSPLVVGDLVFVVTANGVDEGHINIPSPKAPSFIAVNKKTGAVKWTDNSPGTMIMHGQWSNPTYAAISNVPQIIFPGGDGWLRAFEPETGKLIWKFDCNPKASKYELGGKGTKNDFIATPVVYDNKLYIGVGQDPEHFEGVGHVWCIDLEKATALGPKAKDNDVSPVNDNFDPKAAVNKNSALTWHYGGAASKEDVKKTGRDYYFGRTMSTCAIQDGLVYLGELAGYIHCFDAKTGQKYWEHDLKSAVWGSAYWVDGKVYIGTEDGDVWVFGHGKEKKLINKVVIEQPVRSTPVAVNGVLYLMTESHLYAIANK